MDTPLCCTKVYMLLLGGGGGGGGCNPKKPYPSLTFSRVGVGFFWVLLGFFGFFWVLKKLIIFADFCIHNVRICTCYNINIQMMK